MTFAQLLEHLRQNRELPPDVAVPPARIELGRINAQSSASLRLETGGQSPELSNEQLEELARS